MDTRLTVDFILKMFQLDYKNSVNCEEIFLWVLLNCKNQKGGGEEEEEEMKQKRIMLDVMATERRRVKTCGQYFNSRPLSRSWLRE